MTIYIQIPVNNTTFDNRYLELTGETIQTDKPTNEAQTRYLVGSSRCTQEQCDTLRAEFPNVILTNEFPSDWIPLEPTIE